MLYREARPSSLVFFADCSKIITDSYLQIQNYKIEVQLKPKLHQLWRIALCFIVPSSLVLFADCSKIITDSYLQIQNYKIEVQLKPKLHQLWRIALCFGNYKLQLSVFFKDSLSLLTGARSSSPW